MKKLFTLLAISALTMSLFVSGCGSKATESTNVQGNTQTKQEDLKTYKVGTDAAYPPFESVSPSNECEGFDMDLLTAVANAGGFKVEFVNTAWDGIIPSLTQKNNDMVISAMTITPERQKEVNFSDPYFESTNYIVVPESSNIKSIADLKRKNVSVQQGTTGDIAITDKLGTDNAGIKRFKGTPEAFMELKNGKVDAAVADSGVVMEYIKNNPDLKLKFVTDDNFPKENYGIAIRKEDTEILAKVNEGLKKIKENGEYDKVYQKWFGTTK